MRQIGSYESEQSGKVGWRSKPITTGGGIVAGTRDGPQNHVELRTLPIHSFGLVGVTRPVYLPRGHFVLFFSFEEMFYGNLRSGPVAIISYVRVVGTYEERTPAVLSLFCLRQSPTAIPKGSFVSPLRSALITTMFPPCAVCLKGSYIIVFVASKDTLGSFFAIKNTPVGLCFYTKNTNAFLVLRFVWGFC